MSLREEEVEEVITNKCKHLEVRSWKVFRGLTKEREERRGRKFSKGEKGIPKRCPRGVKGREPS